MIDLTRFPRILNLLTLGHLARAALRRGDRQAREVKSNRADFYRTIWSQAARTLDAEIQDFAPGILEISQGDVRFRVRDNYTTLDDPVTLQIVGNKALVHEKLAACDLPIPAFQTFRIKTIRRAVEFLANHESCVVKPAAGTGAGQGITTGIQKRGQLSAAAALAARFCSDLVIEREVPGDNFRLLFLDGKLLEAVRRDPPRITGDGHSAIRQLIQRENQNRVADWKVAQTLLQIDRDMKQTLDRQGLGLRNVPSAGEQVRVKTVINENSAAENQLVTEQVHPDVREKAARAAHILGVRLAGVDLICSDIGRPLRESGGVILEVNTTPGLYHHQRNGRCPVAQEILQAMLDQHRELQPNIRETHF